MRSSRILALCRRRWPVRVAPAALAVLAVSLIVAGCGFARSKPTPILVYVTPEPTPVVGASPAESATLFATAADTAAAGPTMPPPTPTPVATAVPSSTCTGTQDSQALFAVAAGALGWDVYCPILPSGWYFASGQYTLPNGGQLTTTFKDASGAQIVIQEGAFCTSDAASCSPHGSVVGTASFGDLPGSLDALSGGAFAVYVAPGTATAYSITGSGMSRESLLALAAALVKVAKH